MFNIGLTHALEIERSRTPSIESNHIDSKIVLKIGVLPQLVEDHVWILAFFKLDR